MSALTDRDTADFTCRELGDYTGKSAEKACNSVKEAKDSKNEFRVTPSVDFRERSLTVTATCNLGSLDKCFKNAGQSVRKAFAEVSKWITEVMHSVEGAKEVQERVIRVLEDRGVSATSHEYLVADPSRDFGTRYRNSHDLATRNGFGGGFPTFHQATYEEGLVYGVLQISPEAIEFRDIKSADIGEPDSPTARIKVMNEYARSQGFVGAVPTFHEANYGEGRVMGTLLIRKGYADVAAFGASPAKTVRDGIRYGNDKAQYGAYPTFVPTDGGDGFICFRDGVLTHVDALHVELFPDIYMLSVIERPPAAKPVYVPPVRTRPGRRNDPF